MAGNHNEPLFYAAHFAAGHAIHPQPDTDATLGNVSVTPVGGWQGWIKPDFNASAQVGIPARNRGRCHKPGALRLRQRRHVSGLLTANEEERRDSSSGGD